MKKNKLVVFTLIILCALTATFSCKKDNKSSSPSGGGAGATGTTGSTGTTSATSVTLTFNVFQKCSGQSAQPLSGAGVNLYNTASDRDAGGPTWLYSQSTSGGYTTFYGLTPRTYYYKVGGNIQCPAYYIRSINNQITINSNGTFSRNETLYQ